MTNIPNPPFKAALWIGWILTILPSLLLAFAGCTKIARIQPVIDGFGQFGLSVGLAVPLGVVELLCAILCLIPRTAVLGAILATGYMGGAILATLHASQPWLPCLIVGILLWGGLYLRDPRVRSLIPFRG